MSLEKEIDRLCLEFLVRQQPVAGHLRFAYATIKINLELERIGDYAESIARQVLKVSDCTIKIPVRQASCEIGQRFHSDAANAVKAFVDQDAEAGAETMAEEDKAMCCGTRSTRTVWTAREKRADPTHGAEPAADHCAAF